MILFILFLISAALNVSMFIGIILGLRDIKENVSIRWLDYTGSLRRYSEDFIKYIDKK